MSQAYVAVKGHKIRIYLYTLDPRLLDTQHCVNRRQNIISKNVHHAVACEPIQNGMFVITESVLKTISLSASCFGLML